MIKAVQYIKTKGDGGFKEFLSQPFSFEMLNSVSNTQQVLFDNWRVKDMNNWLKYINDDQIELEVYPDHYIIKTNGEKHITRKPLIIDDFLSDMEYYGIQLYWNIWVDENFEPNQYLDVNEIENYYRNKLQDMGKSHELL